MSLNRSRNVADPVPVAVSTDEIQQGMNTVNHVGRELVNNVQSTFKNITETARGALSNSSPAPVSISSPSPKGTVLEQSIGSVVSTTAKMVGGAVLAAALVCVASGLAQEYARKQRYKAGSGKFWTFLATVPSFKHPRPFFYKIASFANGRYVGDENAGDIYKRFCLIPAVKLNSTIYLLDDWGGWMSLYLDKGDGPELVISHDTGNSTVRVVTDDLRVNEYELPPQAEVAQLLFSTEML